MENTTPAVHHNDSYSDEEDGGDDWDKTIIMKVVIYSLVFVLGTLGNGVVIWVTGFRMKKTIKTVLFLNLAVADFLASTAVMPAKITETVMDPRDKPHTTTAAWLWIYCSEHFVFCMYIYVSLYTVVLISVDRCVCVRYPVWTRDHWTVRKASWVCLVVWVLALAHNINLLMIFVGNVYVNIMVIVVCIVGIVVPYSIIVSCYSVIIRQYMNNPWLASPSSRSFKIIAAIFASLFLCWAPFHIMSLMFMLGVTGLIEVEDGDTLAPFVLYFGLPITVTLALVPSCLNPLLYMFCLGFKDVFRSRSPLKVLEKAFEPEEEPPQTNNTPTDPDVTEETPLLEVVR